VYTSPAFHKHVGYVCWNQFSGGLVWSRKTPLTRRLLVYFDSGATQGRRAEIGFENSSRINVGGANSVDLIYGVVLCAFYFLFPRLNNIVFFGVYEPLVMEIFSAIAKEEGCEVELIDLRLDQRGCERLARKGYVPDLIGLTTHGFPEVPIVNQCIHTCKKLWPGAPVVIGGGQATVTPELFDQECIDVIVRGPGERIWRDLCRTGVTAGKCRMVTDPDPPRVYTYPRPDRRITAKYRKHYKTRIPHHSGQRWGRGGRTGFTLLTQGCPFRCSFCVIWPATLGLYRKRPIPEIVADLSGMEEAYVYLGDDNTFADAHYASELADAIQAAGIRKFQAIAAPITSASTPNMEAMTGTKLNSKRTYELFAAARKDAFGKDDPTLAQVLSPYRGEPFGTESLNSYIQAHVNGNSLERYQAIDGITLFDKVIQYFNRPKSNPVSAYNWASTKSEEIEVFNGELGMVKPHGFDKGSLAGRGSG
jgi:hypothetical protein